jgi:hypothetical protein
VKVGSDRRGSVSRERNWMALHIVRMQRPPCTRNDRPDVHGAGLRARSALLTTTMMTQRAAT